MDLHTDIQYLKGVGEKRAKLLARLGVHTVEDLLHFYPRAYEDWSKVVPIGQAQIGEVCCVRAIVDHKPIGVRIRKGMTVYKTDVTDGRDRMTIVIYNNAYLADRLESGDVVRNGQRPQGDPVRAAGAPRPLRPAAEKFIPHRILRHLDLDGAVCRLQAVHDHIPVRGRGMACQVPRRRHRDLPDAAQMQVRRAHVRVVQDGFDIRKRINVKGHRKNLHVCCLTQRLNRI